MEHTPFVIERVYDHPVKKVWAALTDREQMKQWYFDIPDFKPEPGAEFSFTGGDEEIRFVHVCKVTALVTGEEIAYTWAYPDYPGSSLLTFQLFDEGGKTRLRLTHSGLETFPQDLKWFRRESFSGGWNYFVNEALPGYLDK